MCFLIAKKFDQEGCFAVEAIYGPELASLVDYLGVTTLERDVQVLTVSSKEGFKEYKPYHMITTMQEFITLVLEM